MRKLSFEENLRHRLRDLPRLRDRDERPEISGGLLFLALGAAAGIAAGVVIAHKYGGFSALATKLQERMSGADAEEEFVADEYDYYDDDDESEDEDSLSPLEELEELVLDAYHNDPILSERAIDIGAIDEGIIELTGWVYAASEAELAVTIARGTPGVRTVLNRLTVRAEEDQLADSAERYEAGDDRLTEAHWEGQSTGMGRKRPPKSGRRNSVSGDSAASPNLDDIADDISDTGAVEPSV
ncbi:MAG: BON domain-containing protein [Gemmatimonadaceae bacterium]